MDRPSDSRGPAPSLGFTLVELLVGILIFSIVMTALFSSFRTFLFSSRDTDREGVRTRTAHRALSRICRDLEFVFIEPDGRYAKPELYDAENPCRLTGEQVSTGTKFFSRLYFPSFGHIESGNHFAGCAAKIGYFVEQDEDGRLNLYRSDRCLLDLTEMPPCVPPVLFPDIQGFDILFFDDKNEAYDTWDSDSSRFSHTFPKRITVKITYASSGGSRVAETGIILPSGRTAIP